MVSNNQSTWSSCLIWAEFAHNTLHNSSLAMSPFECSIGPTLRQCQRVWLSTKDLPLNLLVVKCHGISSLPATMRATAPTLSVSSVWVFRMYVRRFMGCQNANFVKTSISKPSALGLRFLKGSHPCFPVAPRRPPRPSVNPRPGVRMWSSRRWRASRRASPFLSLSHPSTCA